MKNRRKKPHTLMQRRSSFRQFYRDPVTYAGIAVFTVPPIVAAVLDVNVRNESFPIQAAYFGTSVLGLGMMIYSRVKHNIDPLGDLLENIKTVREYRKESELIDESWSRFENIVTEVEDLEDTRFDHVIRRARGTLARRENLEEAYRIVDEINSIYYRKEKLEAKKSKTNSPPEENGKRPVDERYVIAPMKSYGHMSNNQHARVQYFVDDVKALLDESRRQDLYRTIHGSHWYTSDLTDIQTYMFFDDVTLSLKKGVVPSKNEIDNYLRKVIEEPRSLSVI